MGGGLDEGQAVAAAADELANVPRILDATQASRAAGE
jgi:hypothetical protein